MVFDYMIIHMRNGDCITAQFVEPKELVAWLRTELLEEKIKEARTVSCNYQGQAVFSMTFFG
jgi:hypothetical protein